MIKQFKQKMTSFVNKNLARCGLEIDSRDTHYLYKCLVETGIKNACPFDFEYLKSETLSYVKSLKFGAEIGDYKYSNVARTPNLYSSVYACMIMSLYGELENFSTGDRNKWVAYFDSFQSKEDGLFYDPSIENGIFKECDWWGARHLAIHMIIAYSDLNAKPKYSFNFLEPFYEKDYLIEWLENLEWDNYLMNDIDNRIMNYGVLLQYSRDYLCDEKAGNSVKYLLDWLERRVTPSTGMWGLSKFNTSEELSRTVQFAYHLLLLFTYQGRPVKNIEKIVDYVIKTQNSLGGFGVELNSSACEDIDSIEMLVRMSKLSSYRKEEIKRLLYKALPWVLANMNEDGGFVFKRNEPFTYGHTEMSSGKNESSLFATWFRTLCIAYIVNYLEIENNYRINNVPGMEFK